LKRLILFRFDRQPLVCRDRVALLRELNPGVHICGIFGGKRGYRYWAFRGGGKSFLRLDSLYCSPQPGRWSWNNVDLVLAAWYRDAGVRLDFDVAYVIEWDMLVSDSLEHVYSAVPEGALGLTALTPIAAIQHQWGWLQRSDERRHFEELLAHARSTWGYDAVPHACWGGGACLPRAFLAKYAAIDPAELAPGRGATPQEELRFPLFAQILGFPIVNTGFRTSWDDAQEDRFYNLISREIDSTTIGAELAKADGRRVFHPVRRRVRSIGQLR
jgi:hypothetical protein